MHPLESLGQLLKEHITITVPHGASEITTRLPGPITRILMGSGATTVTSVSGNVITVACTIGEQGEEEIELIVETYHTGEGDIGRTDRTVDPIVETDGPAVNCFVIYTTAAAISVLTPS